MKTIRAKKTVLSHLAPDRIAQSCQGIVLRGGMAPRGVSTDTRTLYVDDLYVALKGDRFDGHRFVEEAFARGARGALISEAMPELLRSRLPDKKFVVQVPSTSEALMQLARIHRDRCPMKVVGITGSCGKTSTKDILTHVLRSRRQAVGSPKSFNNAVGVPLTLFQATENTEIAVVEMGTNRPGEIKQLTDTARPDGAIVTSVFASHLEMLGSVEGVAREKASLIEGLPRGGFAILNADNPHVADMARLTQARVVRVSVEGPGDLVATEVKFNCLGTTFLLDGRIRVTIPRLGTHNVTNTLCALAAARELGVTLEDAVQGLHGLPPTDRRFEPRKCGPVVVYDDSYNMNPGSAKAALQAFHGLAGTGRKVVVFGDMLELGELSDALHYEVGRELGALGFDHLVATGQRARVMAEGAMAAGMPAARVTTTLDRDAATEVLLGILGDGDRVLVKASRRMELDRLVERVATHFGQSGRGLPGVEVCA